YSRTCGQIALDIGWGGDTFSGGDHSGVRTLDVSATYHPQRREISLYIINRHPGEAQETTIRLVDGEFKGTGELSIINGPDIKAENNFEQPYQVSTRTEQISMDGKECTVNFEPHSITALVCKVL